MRPLALFLLLLLAGRDALAQNEEFAWKQHAGATLPRAAILHDEAGRLVALGDLLGAAPVILDLGYFHCPSLCGVARSDLLGAIARSGLTSGRDFVLVSASIDPAETPSDAASAKAADLKQTPGLQSRDMHYLTGDAGPLERAVGFHARYDASFKQFIHPAGLVVLTRTGVISSYLLGVGYAAGDLRAAVLRAGEGGVAQAALPILLLCFHFDSTTGRYTLAVEKVLRLMAAITVLMLGGTLAALHWRGRPKA